MNDPLEASFPGLAKSPFRYTSPIDRFYNCIAWAAGINHVWWWPDGDPPRFEWPASAPRQVAMNAFIAVFQTVGYAVADNADESLEPGIEKVAMFADADGFPKHAARQLPTGQWTSKLGEAEDIEHELRALEGDLYGTVVVFLKRPRVALSE